MPHSALPIDRFTKGRLDSRCLGALGASHPQHFFSCNLVASTFAVLRFLILGEISLLIVYIVADSTAIKLPLHICLSPTKVG